MRLARLFRRTPAPPREVDLTSGAHLADPARTWSLCLGSEVPLRARPAGLLLARHVQVTAALTHPDLSNAPSRYSVLHRSKAGRYEAAALAANILPFLDGPAHVAARRPLSRAFHATFRNAGPMIAERAETIFAAPPAGDPVDLIPVARAFALAAMTRFLGAGALEAAAAKAMTDAFFLLFAPVRDAAAFSRANETLAAARVDLVARVARLRGGPSDGFVSALLAADPDLTDEKVADAALLVFADGVENIEAAIGSVLLTVPADDWADPDVPTATLVEEALRLETPAQVIARVARTETEIAGQPVAEGEAVFLALAAANRDGAVFPDPGRFDAGRDHGAVLTFGGGRHSCIGAPLARALTVAAAEVLRARGARPLPGPVTWRPRFGHRWPEAVGMVFAR